MQSISKYIVIRKSFLWHVSGENWDFIIDYSITVCRLIFSANRIYATYEYADYSVLIRSLQFMFSTYVLRTFEYRISVLK